MFVRRPLRFSLQEFYAITDLKFKKYDNCDEWVDDKGLWSTLLKQAVAFAYRT